MNKKKQQRNVRLRDTMQCLLRCYKTGYLDSTFKNTEDEEEKLEITVEWVDNMCQWRIPFKITDIAKFSAIFNNPDEQIVKCLNAIRKKMVDTKMYIRDNLNRHLTLSVIQECKVDQKDLCFAPKLDRPLAATENDVFQFVGQHDVVFWTDGGKKQRGPTRRFLSKRFKGAYETLLVDSGKNWLQDLKHLA